MINSLHKWINRGWYDRSSWLFLLQPLACLYGLLTSLRRLVWTRGWFRAPDLPLPVVVVGNITVGGAGKTPVVIWLAQQLQSQGLRPGIVSRGYRSRRSMQPRLLPPGADPLLFGDEPVLLADRTGCPVVIGRDRAAAVFCMARQPVDVVIADDGLQHYRLQRNFEVAVVDGERLFGNGRLLPAGPLREPVSRLSEFDAVLVNGGSMGDTAISFQLVPGAAVNPATATERPLQEFSGMRVWAVAGIGNPQRFFQLLRAHGMQVDEVTVADHGVTDVPALLQRCKQPVLMTEKDAVKYSASLSGYIWYVPVSLDMDSAVAGELLADIVRACSQKRARKIPASSYGIRD